MKPKLFSRVQPTNNILFLSNIKNLSSSSGLAAVVINMRLWSPWNKIPYAFVRTSLEVQFLFPAFSWTRIVYSQQHLFQQHRQRSAALLDTYVRWFLPSRPVAQYSNLHFQRGYYIFPCFKSLRLFHGQTCCPFLLENSLYQWFPMYWGGR